MTSISYHPVRKGETPPPQRSDPQELYRLMCGVSAVMLLVALLPLPYGYYALLRLVVCGTSAYGAHIFLKQDRTKWTVSLGLLGILFNPIILIQLGVALWAVIECVQAAVIFVFGRRAVSLRQKPSVCSPQRAVMRSSPPGPTFPRHRSIIPTCALSAQQSHFRPQLTLHQLERRLFSA